MSGELMIGGSKGHVEEVVTDPIFISIYAAFRWKRIPNCTGRYTCRDHNTVSHLTPLMLLRAACIDASTITGLKQYYITFDHGERRNPIYVVPFADDGLTGLISYVKMQDEEGIDHSSRFVHTLNSMSGFQRKLSAINVVLSDENLDSS
ncbi:hypothetical protein ACHAWU_000379 [Discostella pseudostelligera]|uniref:Uncharacterized protein n=1 Tax=Discostella pseudostelligera TaxID=259834 RepID=A0ABD3M1X7_9STRA